MLSVCTAGEGDLLARVDDPEFRACFDEELLRQDCKCLQTVVRLVIGRVLFKVGEVQRTKANLDLTLVLREEVAGKIDMVAVGMREEPCRNDGVTVALLHKSVVEVAV